MTFNISGDLTYIILMRQNPGISPALGNHFRNQTNCQQVDPVRGIRFVNLLLTTEQFRQQILNFRSDLKWMYKLSKIDIRPLKCADRIRRIDEEKGCAGEFRPVAVQSTGMFDQQVGEFRAINLIINLIFRILFRTGKTETEFQFRPLIYGKFCIRQRNRVADISDAWDERITYWKRASPCNRRLPPKSPAPCPTPRSRRSGT